MWEVFKISFIDQEAYKEVLKGLGITLLTAFVALIIGIVLGTIVAFVQLANAKQKAWLVPIKGICKGYVSFFRGTPIVIQLLFIYFVILPYIGLGTMEPFVVGIIIFGLNSGAYVSEIMRGGILSVDKGQTEAGRALGLSSVKTMIKVVIPQAIKNVIPTIANEFISLLKETSVLSFIGIVDLYKAFREIGAANTEFTIPYLVLAICYMVMILIATFLVKLLERRLRASDRR